ncbi:peptide chain release factor N(5)-glutamine methyltransferase [Thiorhodovibrio frisius]|uniref:Release factor glutamine methyltransferase n=1 Tax=Thiorhodovibrio frisius TaxID=631362 RepID=H8Z2W8_9GAMM|nr:peptide chain release factor N(5)-glutamine methyltransferase [Thiorhodovibrio frisius]EIC21704.1 protein-(glutamine-N5) methyltransferase, release factor-specific [Thiorhodovibrio frisius]WPL21672.1 Release factor glutamine methyltransferase [Thiorhodovibrio frisius]
MAEAPAPSAPAPADPAPSIAALLHWGRAQLTASATPTARLEAELLLATAASLGRTDLIAWPERQIGEPEQTVFAHMIRRRSQGEPIAYVLGEREFRGLPLRVSPATLIPRPETELLVDWALAQHPPTASIRCADLGTGSGAIALAIALERPHWQVLALDRSGAALAIAATNCQRLKADQIQLIQSDWLSPIAAQRLDLILANPPYVAAQDPHLTRGDLPFEPASALIAGNDGLAAIRRIAAELPRHLTPTGRAAIEHGWDQGAAVRTILNQAGLTMIETHRDLAGHERFTSARRSSDTGEASGEAGAF